jgi:hypothetical protein
MIPWDKCRRDFEPDGGLRDIYVHSTTMEHWRALYETLRIAHHLEYSVDGTPQSLPVSVDEAFAARSTSSNAIRFRVGSALVVCHFFATDEIEMDIDPREVASQAALDELLGLLRLVGDTLGTPVGLTYEGDEQHPFITYEPSTRVSISRSSSLTLARAGIPSCLPGRSSTTSPCCPIRCGSKW